MKAVLFNIPNKFRFCLHPSRLCNRLVMTSLRIAGPVCSCRRNLQVPFSCQTLKTGRRVWEGGRRLTPRRRELCVSTRNKHGDWGCRLSYRKPKVIFMFLSERKETDELEEYSPWDMLLHSLQLLVASVRLGQDCGGIWSSRRTPCCVGSYGRTGNTGHSCWQGRSCQSHCNISCCSCYPLYIPVSTI